MTAFDINHNGYLEINEQLYQAVGRVGTIIESLNIALRNIPNAMQGQAAPLWEEQQRTWNGHFADLQSKLNADTLRSIDVHEIFKGGDNTGARIMLQ